MSKPIIVIPTYNEVANIAPMIASIQSALECRIVVVDDNSPDGTGDLLRKLSDNNARLTVIHRNEKGGLASAYCAGLLKALALDGDPIIQMDCDFSHSPTYLNQLVAASHAYDLVIGSKYTPGGRVEGLNWWRRALSRYGNRYLSWAVGSNDTVRLSDYTSGYLCWRPALLRQIDFGSITSHGYAFLIELKLQALNRGARIAEIPIVFRDRVAGKSKLTPHIIKEALWLPFHIRAKARQRI